ncbi:hypothetical protein EVA_03851 [gut metagenome]|uniref:Uncharacterized protein n=1 Tax=gut metagenome TaxID=749906 RepID=J9GJZ3_9ZZZZ
MHTVGEDATQSSSDFSHQMVMLTSWYVCGFGQRLWCNAMGAQRLYGRGMPRPEAEVTTALNKLRSLMARGMPRPYNCSDSRSRSNYCHRKSCIH